MKTLKAQTLELPDGRKLTIVPYEGVNEADIGESTLAQDFEQHDGPDVEAIRKGIGLLETFLLNLAIEGVNVTGAKYQKALDATLDAAADELMSPQ